MRLLDTRRTGGLVRQGQPQRIWVEPGTTAVAINLAATEAADAGFVTAYPCDQPVPATSNLNVVAGQTLSNHAQVAVSPQGELCIVTSMTTHLVVDLVGAFSRRPGRMVVPRDHADPAGRFARGRRRAGRSDHSRRHRRAVPCRPTATRR